MHYFKTLLSALVLTNSLGALAHEGVDHKNIGPVKKEQKEWGIAGDAKAVRRTVELSMSDGMRFTPDHIDVQQGEVVKIIIKNSGKMFHEMVIGTKAELDEHAALMAKFPNMEHDEPYMAHVKPGAKGEIIWNFNRAGNFEFACLVAGHYQAGMVGKITVSGTNASSPLSAPSASSTMAELPASAAKGSSDSATQELSAGEVRKVDLESKKITLKHGEMKNLDMPPMTMVFQVSDPALLDEVKPGDKVRFRAIHAAGKLTITEMEPVK